MQEECRIFVATYETYAIKVPWPVIFVFSDAVNSISLVDNSLYKPYPFLDQDIGAAASSRQLKRAHVGHVTALAWSDAGASPQSEERTELFLTGGQDGFLRAWDGRTDRAVAEVPVHVAASGTGEDLMGLC